VDGFARKEALKRILYYVCGGLTHFSGAGKARGLADSPGSLRILMYHKINDQSGNSVSVPTARFAEQMAFLEERYQVVSADAVLAHLATGDPLPTRAVLLTFDDGYRDVFTNAYPILKRHGYPATLFVSSDFIGTNRVFPHDVRLARFDNAVINWAELRELSDTFEIGAHACSHRALTAMDLAEARREICESKAVIEDRLGHRVRLFAYPKGGPLDFNGALRHLVIDAGYEACFTTIPKTNRQPLQRFDLGRYNAEPYGRSYFEWLLEGSCDLMGLTATPLGATMKRAIVSGMRASLD
jgi:peptidoglycan/xylan/chitin deacetylase (PgdA/CDA1 family)